MTDKFDRRIFMYVCVSFVVLTLVALMVLPIGIPYFEHVISYWWAEPKFQSAVGQDHKAIWYQRSLVSMLFCLWILFGVWAWWKLLPKKSWICLSWAYFVFCATVIGSQFLVMGGWHTHAEQNLSPSWDDCPSIVRIVDGIDSPSNFMRDMVKYAGVDGRLRGPLFSKAPAYVLVFYFIDQVGRKVLSVMGLAEGDLALRAAAMACLFTMLTGLFIFPFFFTAQMLFSESAAKIGLLMVSFNPMAAYGFENWMAWSHHLLLLISSISIFLLFLGLKTKNWVWVALAIGFAISCGLVIWESFALVGLLIFFLWAYFYDKSRPVSLKEIPIFKILGGFFALILALSFGLNYFLSFNLWQYFWDYLLVGHVSFVIQKMFFSHGPLLYFLSLITNVTGFLFFLGIAVAVQLIYSIRGQWRSNEATVTRKFFMGLLSFVILLNLSGMSTETGRLWAFLAPAFYICALSEFHGTGDDRKAWLAGLTIFCIQGLQILVERNVFFSV